MKFPVVTWGRAKRHNNNILHVTWVTPERAACCTRAWIHCLQACQFGLFSFYEKLRSICFCICFALEFTLTCALVIGFTPLEVSGLCIHQESHNLAAQCNRELSDHWLQHILTRLQCPSRPVEGAWGCCIGEGVYILTEVCILFHVSGGRIN